MIGYLTTRLRVKRRLAQHHRYAAIRQRAHGGHDGIRFGDFVPDEAAKLGRMLLVERPLRRIAEIIGADGDLT